MDFLIDRKSSMLGIILDRNILILLPEDHHTCTIPRTIGWHICFFPIHLIPENFKDQFFLSLNIEEDALITQAQPIIDPINKKCSTQLNGGCWLHIVQPCRSMKEKINSLHHIIGLLERIFFSRRCKLLANEKTREKLQSIIELERSDLAHFKNKQEK